MLTPTISLVAVSFLTTNSAFAAEPITITTERGLPSACQLELSFNPESGETASCLIEGDDAPSGGTYSCDLPDGATGENDRWGWVHVELVPESIRECFDAGGVTVKKVRLDGAGETPNTTTKWQASSLTADFGVGALHGDACVANYFSDRTNDFFNFVGPIYGKFNLAGARDKIKKGKVLTGVSIRGGSGQTGTVTCSHAHTEELIPFCESYDRTTFHLRSTRFDTYVRSRNDAVDYIIDSTTSPRPSTEWTAHCQDNGTRAFLLGHGDRFMGGINGVAVTVDEPWVTDLWVPEPNPADDSWFFENAYGFLSARGSDDGSEVRFAPDRLSWERFEIELEQDASFCDVYDGRAIRLFNETHLSYVRGRGPYGDFEVDVARDEELPTRWSVTCRSDGLATLTSNAGRFLGLQPPDEVALAESINFGELWEIHRNSDNTYSFMAIDGSYLSLRGSHTGDGVKMVPHNREWEQFRVELAL